MKKGLFFFSLLFSLLLMAPVILSSRMFYGHETPVERKLEAHLLVNNRAYKCWAPLSGTGLQQALVMASHRQLNNRSVPEALPATDFNHKKTLLHNDLNGISPHKVMPAPITLPQ
ncbi:hypothetical protein [Taibaiella soli]|uniref:Uncharacterized protein n=1 Tax=Taibaiella soli TaxID=1649169 RepID=A0A2W2B498_9BACT|nr:hypothetical protein [Taibaiella soli]PZF74878.1 hypothetical protein DN068_01390 [Taibaiella soli]